MWAMVHDYTICSTLKYCSSRFIYHGDIRPGNILVTEDGIIKLFD